MSTRRLIQTSILIQQIGIDEGTAYFVEHLVLQDLSPVYLSKLAGFLYPCRGCGDVHEK